MLEKEQDRWLTVPNVLSGIRLLMIAPTAYYLWNGQNWNAAIITIIAGLIDIADGNIARYFNQKSELGKILDPLADKLFVAMLVIILLLQGKVPVWYFSAIVLRDILIMLGGLYASRKVKVVLPSNLIGKLTALIVGLSLIAAIVEFELVFTILMITGLFLMIASLMNYAQIMFKQLKGT